MRLRSPHRIGPQPATPALPPNTPRGLRRMLPPPPQNLNTPRTGPTLPSDRLWAVLSAVLFRDSDQTIKGVFCTLTVSHAPVRNFRNTGPFTSGIPASIKT